MNEIEFAIRSSSTTFILFIFLWRVLMICKSSNFTWGPKLEALTVCPLVHSHYSTEYARAHVSTQHPVNKLLGEYREYQLLYYGLLYRMWVPRQWLWGQIVFVTFISFWEGGVGLRARTEHAPTPTVFAGWGGHHGWVTRSRPQDRSPAKIEIRGGAQFSWPQKKNG